MVARKQIARAALAVAFLIALSTLALALTLDFVVIQPLNSTPADLAQVDLSVDITAGVGQVFFSFFNDSLDATVSEIYFEDTLGLLSGGVVEYGLSAGTLDFVIGSVNPTVLPNGDTLIPAFIVTTSISAESVGADSNGINAGEVLVLSYLGDYEDLETAVFAGLFRIGLHVRSIGSGDDSDAFIGIPETLFNPAPVPSGTVVPEPAIMSILALGLMEMALRMRRKTTALVRV